MESIFWYHKATNESKMADLWRKHIVKSDVTDYQ